MAKSLLRASAISAAAFIAQNAFSQVLYNNSTTYNGDYIVNGETGNEVVLAGSASSDVISGITLQYDLLNADGGMGGTPNPTDSVDVRFYANTGAIVDGYASPAATPLYDSGAILLSALGVTAYTEGATLIDTGLNVTVPQDFTWTLTFGGLGGDEGSLGLFSSPSVGSNYGDAWVNSGDGWALVVAGDPPPALEFGAEITGTAVVPDSSSLSFSVLAIGAGFGLVKRSIRRQHSA